MLQISRIINRSTNAHVREYSPTYTLHDVTYMYMQLTDIDLAKRSRVTSTVLHVVSLSIRKISQEADFERPKTYPRSSISSRMHVHTSLLDLSVAYSPVVWRR